MNLSARRDSFLTPDLLWVLSVFAVAASVLFYRLGEPALKNWDEGLYAEIAREMLQTGDWLNLKWQQALWFEKPPLTFWSTALLFRQFGVNEFSARAIAALSGAGTVAVTYAIGNRIFNRACGLVAALILMTTFQFVQISRLLNTDVLLLFFIVLAIYGYLRTRDGDGRWWYLVSTSCALGFMVKDFAVVSALAAIALAVVFDRQLLETINSKHFRFSVLLALAIVIPWHALMYFRHGAAFVNEYFYYHVFSRTVSALEGHGESRWFYLEEIRLKFYPWCFIAPFGIAFHLWQVKQKRVSAVVLVLIVFVFGFYTAAQTKMSWYILPLYPAFALVIAHLLTWLCTRWHFLAVRIVIILVCVVCTYLAIGKIASYYVRIEESDEATKQMALLVARDSISPTLILFSPTEQLDPQAAAFYSKRPVVQASTYEQRNGGHPTRYHDYKLLADVATEQPSAILLMKDQVEALSGNYEIIPRAESRNLVYATIRSRRLTAMITDQRNRDLESGIRESR